MSTQDQSLVPGKDHYYSSYVRGGRMFSYAHQMDAALGCEPQSVLEIGPGPGVVTSVLRRLNIAVTTVDVQPELQPDVIASVVDLPFDDRSFDASMCCQVLEHLPFEHFVPALEELRRVSRKRVVVSLPDCSIGYRLHGTIPKLGSFQMNWSRNRRSNSAQRQLKLDRDGHYWEIGYPAITSKVVLNCFLESGLSVSRSWRVPEMPYHRFFVADLT